MSRHDVVVVGAGAAGLACAQALAANGADVVVLEARDRIGGRVWTCRDFGEPVELGAMLVHGEHAVTWELITEAGLHADAAAPRFAPPVVVMNGEALEASGVYARAGLQGLAAIERMVAGRSPPDRPLTSELREMGLTGDGAMLAAEWFAQIWCADPDNLSAEGVGRVEREWTSGYRNFVIREGYDAVLEHLARDLDVRTATRVHRIRWAPGRVEVHAPRGMRLQARAAVLTVPPPALERVAILPGLPERKVAAAARIAIGPAIRVVARLAEPAPHGASVTVVGEHGGMWRVAEGGHVLTGWIGGPAAARMSGMPLRSMLQVLAPALPWLRRADFDEVRMADWGADPLSRGAYSYPAVGGLDAPEVWAEPVACTLLFAGEATCGDHHPATVHGAISSGLRAAREAQEYIG